GRAEAVRERRLPLVLLIGVREEILRYLDGLADILRPRGRLYEHPYIGHDRDLFLNIELLDFRELRMQPVNRGSALRGNLEQRSLGEGQPLADAQVILIPPPAAPPPTPPPLALIASPHAHPAPRPSNR